MKKNVPGPRCPAPSWTGLFWAGITLLRRSSCTSGIRGSPREAGRGSPLQADVASSAPHPSRPRSPDRGSASPFPGGPAHLRPFLDRGSSSRAAATPRHRRGPLPRIRVSPRWAFFCFFLMGRGRRCLGEPMFPPPRQASFPRRTELHSAPEQAKTSAGPALLRSPVG